MDIISLFSHGAFFFGLVLQAVITVWGKMTKDDVQKAVGRAILSAMFVFAMFGIERTKTDWLAYLIVTTVLFLIVFNITFREKVLPTISEWSLVVWGMCFSMVVGLYFSLNPITLSMLGVSIIVLVVSVLPSKLPLWVKGALYLWYACMAVVLAVWLVPDMYWAGWAYPANQALSHPTPLQTFFVGMSVYYALSLCVYVFDVLTTHHEGERLAHKKIFATRFTDTQYHPAAMLVLMVVVAVAMLGNMEFHLLNEKLLVAIILGIVTIGGDLTPAHTRLQTQ